MDSFWKLRGSYSSFLRVQEEGVTSLQEEEAAVEAAELWELQRASGTLVSAASRAVRWRICPRSSLPSLPPAALTGLARTAGPGLPLGICGAVLQVRLP